MKKSILATIYYTVDSDHPDFYNPPIEVLSFSDVYTFDMEYYDQEDVENYIKNDLMLVAGGGYNTKHIHNISFDFTTNQRKIDDFKAELKRKFAAV